MPQESLYAAPHCITTELVVSSLARSHARTAEVGAFDGAYVDRLQAQLAPTERQLARERPIAFLDETTTRNIIVQNGRLSETTDLDVVCFSDPVWTIGPTQMASLSSGSDLDYARMWCNRVAASAWQPQPVARSLSFNGRFTHKCREGGVR
jgi:hypothetical protein